VVLGLARHGTLALDFHSMDDKDKKSNRNISTHILPTSANLLGICFLIFSLARFSDKAESTILDEAAACAVVVFLASCVFSYMSLRSESAHRLEKWADGAFLAGLFILATCSVALAVHFAN
jgi:uncharacterized membrane protein